MMDCLTSTLIGKVASVTTTDRYSDIRYSYYGSFSEEIKDCITYQKCDFMNFAKLIIEFIYYLMFKGTEVLTAASRKTKSFAETFPENFYLNVCSSCISNFHSGRTMLRSFSLSRKISWLELFLIAPKRLVLIVYQR